MKQDPHLLLVLELLEDTLELLLLLLGFAQRGLVLLVVRHGHHRQDEVNEVEGAQEDHHHEEEHVRFARRPQDLRLEQTKSYDK